MLLRENIERNAIKKHRGTEGYGRFTENLVEGDFLELWAVLEGDQWI